MPYGLTEKDIDLIKARIADFPEVEKAILFGSRAKGTQNEGSDIDLVLMGNISHQKLLSLKSALNALHLPYTFDVIFYSKINREALKEHIDCVGITFFSKQNSTQKPN